MASASTISSSSYSRFEANSTNLRDDSFSSYLALIRQSFSSELANPNSRRSPFQTAVVPPPKRPFKDNGELDVFGAEKYFSGTLEDTDTISETTTTVTKKSGTRSRSSTCSETSANSRSMLLRDRRPQKQPCPAPRRRSFLDVFRCFCSKETAIKVEDDADTDSSNKSSSKLPGISSKTMHSESSSDLFEIDRVSMSSLPVYDPVSVSRSSGLLGFGYVSDKAVRSTVAGCETERVGSLERYHVMMDLESVSVAGSVAARPRRTSVRY